MGSRQAVARLLVVVLMYEIVLSTARSTLEKEKAGVDEVDFKVIIKREAVSPPQEGSLPFVEGRTFRASEPLDPGNDGNQDPQNIYEHFETVNQIFQPVVEGGDEVTEAVGRHEDYETDPELFDDPIVEGGIAPENYTSTKADTDNVAEQVKDTADDEGDTEPKYSAQYPYTQTSNVGAGTGPYETVSSERRVTLVGGGPRYEQPAGHQTGTRVVQTHTSYQDNSRSNTGSNPYGYASGGQPSRNRYQTGSSYTGRTTGSGYTSGSYNPDTGRRGAYYDGPVYRDDNGHYIDANGRHLDSTGRYYDTSGRFRDAVVTRTTTYGGPVTYVDPTDGGGSRTTYSSSSSQTQTSSGFPINSYGGNQFYHSGGSRYPTTYDPVVSQMSSDPNCPVTFTRVTINGLSCNDAISQIGRFVCYNYERVSQDCCQRCLQVKQQDQSGCEYGDRSTECQNIEPSACYNERNRQVCCQRCAAFLSRQEQSNALTQRGCEYGDYTRNCTSLLHTPHLCYLANNQRVCCNTCPRIARSEPPNCQWGDQSPEFCEPYDPRTRQLKINCYIQAVRNICCQTCDGLKSRIRTPISGCEFGDSPTLFRTSQGSLDCVQYIHRYGVESCDENHTAQACCYTCYRYQQHRRQQQRG